MSAHLLQPSYPFLPLPSQDLQHYTSSVLALTSEIQQRQALPTLGASTAIRLANAMAGNSPLKQDLRALVWAWQSGSLDVYVLANADYQRHCLGKSLRG